MDYVEPVQAVIPGVQGRVLAVLAATETELTMRSVARLAGVSVNRAASVLNGLVELGIVRRREAGRSALVALDPENEASRHIAALATIRDSVLARLRRTARSIRPRPASLVVFGSLARGAATVDSDVDVLAVRATGIGLDDDRWVESLGRWRDRASRIVGNSVNLVVFEESEMPELLHRRQPMWREIAKTGIVLTGSALSGFGSAA